ncbi:MAG: hypothetical protein ACREFD_12415 [Stellaceae bacterium]
MRRSNTAGFRDIATRFADIAAICLVILIGIELSASFLAPGLRRALGGATGPGLGAGYLAFGVVALAVALQFGRKLIDRLQSRIEGGVIPTFAAPVPAAARPRFIQPVAPARVPVYRAKKLSPVSAR